MKKTMSILIAALLLLTVVTGCSKPKAAKKADSETIKANGKLVVGITDFAPMDSMGDTGEWIDFDADLARACAESLGVKAEVTGID
ncbi:MAG: amino acid ABC transporter substrate-binding protein, partial [Clostridia bacterium]|nr:amino acid ABC transporter substrate-binding protein [Clostridia bacterium]